MRSIKQSLIEFALPKDLQERIDQAPLNLNSTGFDPWGLNPETAKAVVAATLWLYKKYFRVEVHGIENIPKGRALIAANHGGQIPLDAMMVALALLIEADPPRITRGMVERWAPSLPFFSTLFTRCGQVTGDPKNCRDLLNKDECVMVFPEGVRGSGKTFDKRYQLQRFGTGFIRLAIETNTPIIPTAIIGCEESYPGIFNAKILAKLIKAPYFPVTPFFPLFGPLGVTPLPTKVTIRFSKPLLFEGNKDTSDHNVQDMVNSVMSSMDTEIQTGLDKRGKSIFTGRAF